MPIDPASIVLTAISFALAGGKPLVKSATIDQDGRFSFEYSVRGLGKSPAVRTIIARLDELAARLTAHIRDGAPLPDAFYSGRESSPEIRAIYRQVRGDVVQARSDWLNQDDTPLEVPPNELPAKFVGLPGVVMTPKGPRQIAPPPGKNFVTPVTDPMNPDFLALEFRPQFGGIQKSPVGEEDYFVPKFVRNAHRSVPGGVFGFAQQTPAGQRQLVGGLRSGGGRTRSRRSAVRARSASRRMAARPRRANGRKPRPGTKAWMSYIRGLRRK